MGSSADRSSVPEKFVVVAHPEATIRIYAQGFFFPYNVTVLVAANEVELLNFAGDRTKDIRAVLLSEALPRTDLISLIKKLRGDDFFVPLVVLGDRTAITEELERRLAVDFGILSLEKRYDFFEFVELLREFWD